MSTKIQCPPTLTVIGHVTRDHINGTVRLGGAASFAARAAAGIGVRTGVVTAAPADAELLAPLTNNPNIELALTPTPDITAFELDYSTPVRQVRLLARAPDIEAPNVPARFRRADLVYVAPVAGECGRALIESLETQTVVVGGQGWLRATNPDGRVIPALLPEARHVPRGLSGIVFSELDHPDAEDLARRFADQVPVVALTRGARGATIHAGGTEIHIPAEPAVEVDPTGAGDVFGLVLGLALHRGATPAEAGRLAAAAAARLVEGPGMGRLGEFSADPAWRTLGAA